MALIRGSYRIATCVLGAAAGLVFQPGPAAAFPLDDPLHPSIVPAGGELAAPDVQQLNHQMGLLSGFGSAPTGWTVSPSIGLQEAFTDNILQTHEPRRWDVITIISPGIDVVGDTSRVQLRLSYQPELQMHLRTGSENALTHQLNATGRITVIPDLLFVDVRGLAGVQSFSGGVGGLGTLGASSVGALAIGSLAQTSQVGAAKQDLYQSSSFSISPYLLHDFGDTGTGRIGLSLSETSTSQISGFTAMPFLAGGGNAQRQTDIEETASFQTGSIFSRARDTVSVSADQSFGYGQSSAVGLAGVGDSDRESVNNRVDYVWDQSVSFYGQFGWERLNYSNPSYYSLNGPTWGFGATFTPDPDTSITLGYGRQDGTTSFTFDGHYAITARTTLAGSYHSGVTTQTGLLRNQLFASSVANNGSLVNSVTGAPQFLSVNALGLTPGVFRFSDLTLSAVTVLERDTVTATLSYTTRTPVGSGSTGLPSEAKTAGVSWVHLITPRLTLNTSLYFSTGTPTGLDKENSIAAGVSGNYTLSETVSAFARYALFERQSSSAALSMYQNLLLVGINKHF